MSTPGEIPDFIPFLEHWRGLPRQRAAMVEFWSQVPRFLKARDASWYQTWQQDGRQAQPRSLSNPLEAPYYSQRDSVTAQALRMCFSSSCAMLLETLRPGTLLGPNGDDTYLGRVLRYGDTTDAAAQLQALTHYGVRARFVKNGGWDLIEQQIDRGVPVPIGVLHHGPVTAPTGGGHWICAIGYDDTHATVHDPFGEMDLVAGGYLNGRGRRLRYSRKNLGRRWMVEGLGSGWAVVAEP